MKMRSRYRRSKHVILNVLVISNNSLNKIPMRAYITCVSKLYSPCIQGYLAIGFMLAYTERMDHVLTLWNCLHDACIIVSEPWKSRNQPMTCSVLVYRKVQVLPK